jgi:CheY-like chemotaxis protein
MRSASPHRASNPSVILLVDDNRDGILARSSILKELGYIVIAAISAADALDALKQHTVDLVITDYKMTPMNGVELIAKLRQNYPAIPVILLTGFAESLGLTPQNTGANIVMQKSANELSELLRHTKRLLQPPRKPPRSQRVGESNKYSKSSGPNM